MTHKFKLEEIVFLSSAIAAVDHSLVRPRQIREHQSCIGQRPTTPPKVCGRVQQKDLSPGPQDHFSRSRGQGVQVPRHSYPAAQTAAGLTFNRQCDCRTAIAKAKPPGGGYTWGFVP